MATANKNQNFKFSIIIHGEAGINSCDVLFDSEDLKGYDSFKCFMLDNLASAFSELEIIKYVEVDFTDYGDDLSKHYASELKKYVPHADVCVWHSNEDDIIFEGKMHEYGGGE